MGMIRSPKIGLSWYIWKEVQNRVFGSNSEMRFLAWKFKQIHKFTKPYCTQNLIALRRILAALCTQFIWVKLSCQNGSPVLLRNHCISINRVRKISIKLLQR